MNRRPLWISVKRVRISADGTEVMLRAFGKDAKPCSPQEWRVILSLGILLANSEPSKNTASFAEVKKVRDLIGECLQAAGMVERSLTRPPPETDVRSQVINTRKARVMIWELCEMNFRWELQALDRRLYNKSKFTPLSRQDMLLDCFSTKYRSIACIDVSRARNGLASPQFKDRLPFLQALWRLMDGWPGRKPSFWSHRAQDAVLHPQDNQWERDLVRYYTQTFFDHFSRPAILPHTLSQSDLESLCVLIAGCVAY